MRPVRCPYRWDFWVRLVGGPAARLGKLATDVLEPSNVFKYPRPVRRSDPRPAQGATAGRGLLGRRRKRATPSVTEIRLYYTVTAHLAFKTVSL